MSEKCQLEDNSRLVLAVSGGPDSMCLLDLISKLPYQLNIAHLNHHLRPNADREQKFVEQKADAYGLSVYSQVIDVQHFAEKNKTGIEEAARNARYQFLFNIAKKTRSIAVLTGHHADDQVETILMNLIRGAGWDGLAGMEFQSYTVFNKKIPLVRPFLEVRKDEIIEYCRNNHLDYMVDESNQDTAYFRNKIRNELLPLLRKYNPKFNEALLRNQKILADGSKFIHAKKDTALETLKPVDQKNFISFSLENYAQIDDAIKTYVLRDLINNFNPDTSEITYEKLEKGNFALNSCDQTQCLMLENDLFLMIERGKGIICRDPNFIWENHWPTLESKLTVGVKDDMVKLDRSWCLKIQIFERRKIGNAYLKNPDVFRAYLDMSTLNNEIVIRQWKTGDTYKPLGMQGKKIKLSDFWINKKIPQRARKRWPVLESHGEIIWIPGFQPSHDCRISDETRMVIILKIERNP